MRHALRRIVGDRSGKFEILLGDKTRTLRTPSTEIPAPLVVRCLTYTETTREQRARFSKAVMFARDNFTCQYCGYQPRPGRVYKELTVDHVRPAHMFSSRAAATFFGNCVAACSPCNTKKGGMLPMQAGMYPAKTPRNPNFVQLRFAGRLNGPQLDYVNDYFTMIEQEAQDAV